MLTWHCCMEQSSSTKYPIDSLKPNSSLWSKFTCCGPLGGSCLIRETSSGCKSPSRETESSSGHVALFDVKATRELFELTLSVSFLRDHYQWHKLPCSVLQKPDQVCYLHKKRHWIEIGGLERHFKNTAIVCCGLKLLNLEIHSDLTVKCMSRIPRCNVVETREVTWVHFEWAPLVS